MVQLKNASSRPFQHEWPRNDAEHQALDAWVLSNVNSLVHESLQTIRDELIQAGISPSSVEGVVSRLKHQVFSVWASRLLMTQYRVPRGTDEFLAREFNLPTPRRPRFDLFADRTK
jgi:hypothetical protein